MYLQKYHWYQTIVCISKILSGEIPSMVRFPKELTIDDLTYFKYAPITSCNYTGVKLGDHS